jgi:uncharacterized protein (DUF1697 family)
MTTYISILRGINVSGHRIIKMEALRQLFAELGFSAIQTYIQSGNVVFQYRKTIQKKLEILISNAISDKFGFDVPVIVRELNELKQIVKSNPFISDKTKDTSFMHVTFLSDEPGKEKIVKLGEGDYKGDEFRYNNKTIYLYCPGTYGDSKLTNSYLENKLKVNATTRNWKTTNELLIIAEKTDNS